MSKRVCIQQHTWGKGQSIEGKRSVGERDCLQQHTLGKGQNIEGKKIYQFKLVNYHNCLHDIGIIQTICWIILSRPTLRMEATGFTTFTHHNQK